MSEAYIEFPEGRYGEGSLEATSHGGGISIAVTAEQAVDSYNQDFTCTRNLTAEEAVKLAEFLLAAAGTREGGRGR